MRTCSSWTARSARAARRAARHKAAPGIAVEWLETRWLAGIKITSCVSGLSRSGPAAQERHRASTRQKISYEAVRQAFAVPVPGSCCYLMVWTGLR